MVFGGRSRLGRALFRRTSALRSIVRTPGDRLQGQTIVNDFSAIEPWMLEGSPSVIYTVGITRGSDSELDRVNADLAFATASTARNAGVPRFIYISSFSVYGECPMIGADSPARPVSGYGRSKWRAEQMLADLADRDFETISVRLPSLYDLSYGKLVQLISAWTRFRIFPGPVSHVQRSFMSFDNAAALILRLATADQSETTKATVAAADSAPFCFDRARQVVADATHRRIFCPRLPVLDAVLGATAPGLYSSLFQNSLLQSEYNAAGEIPSTLYADIAHIAQRTAGLP